MSNYRAQSSKNLSQIELFNFILLVLEDIYLNIKDLIL